MKAFKKWYKKQKPTQYEQPSCSDAWKAALEWVLSTKQAPESVAVLIEPIEKELED